MTNLNDLKARHAEACRYPHTSPDMFEHPTLIHIDTNETVADENIRRASIETSAISWRLEGTTIELPTYNICTPNEEPLKNRIAILGIGSNCSPEVLLKKFRSAGIGGDVYLAQATLDKHAVVHSAFIGAHAYMPSTVIPEEESKSFITVGFYTPQQAEKLTETEPNYDLVQKSGVILTRQMETNPILQHGALLYVSIWGAFAEDGKTPVLQAGIPQTSPLFSQDTSWTARKAAQITGYENNVLRLADTIKPGLEHLPTRLEHTFKLHPHHALAATIAGYRVRESLLYKQAANLTIPPLPRIRYL